MKYYAIIVGGGSGSRMQADTPKQFMLLAGRPVIMHTIEVFHKTSIKPEIFLVLHDTYHNYWKQLCVEHHFDIPHKLVSGGEHRFHSVQNALNYIKEGIVAIQDGVRPLTNQHNIELCYQEAQIKGNAVLGVLSTDSVRQVRVNTPSVQLNRNEIFLVQTPQVFKTEILKKAFKNSYRPEFTDDASVVEYDGEEINLVIGQPGNIKITYAEDLVIANSILNLRAGK